MSCKTTNYGFNHKNSAPDLRQKFSPLRDTGDGVPQKKMTVHKKASLRLTLGYTPAKLITGKRWYVEFYSFDPEIQALHRKRVSVPPIKPMAARKKYAADVAAEINSKLSKGWNPFLALNNPNSYILFEDVCEKYFRYLYKLVEEGIMRPKTYNGYTSFLNVFRSWNNGLEKPVTYVYQMKSELVSDFLDYIWMDKGKSARTRDNYLGWFKSFSAWLMEKKYINEELTAGLSSIQGKRKYEKNRTVIPQDVMVRIKRYCEENNRHFLLACYIEYYCLIRPKEMSYIKIQDISVKHGTISVSAEVSKNRKSAVVTLPDCVVKYMLDLDVLNQPGDYYLFSDSFMPGKKYHSPKHFGDFWTLKMKKALRLPAEYKFYSLKDTGITDLIRANTDLLSVRDQARHHSLQMTDLYTPLESREANDAIRHHQSYF